MTSTSQKEIRVKGLALSPGVAMGTAQRVRGLDLNILAEFAHNVDDVETEVVRFRQAVALSRDQITKLCDGAQSQLAAIVTAQAVILEDEEVTATIVDRIVASRFSSERVVAEQAMEWAARFDALKDKAMRSRAMDIQDAYHRVLRNLLEIEHVRQNPLSEVPPNTILVSERLLPSDILHLHLPHVDGIVTEFGSAVSHAAIAAQSLHIPFVSEVAGATTLIRTGDRVLMDADAGWLIVNPTEDSVNRSRAASHRVSHVEDPANRAPCATRDGIQIALLANASSAEDVATAVAEGTGGIGLLRTEFFCIGQPDMPSAEDEVAFYQNVFEAAGHLRVTFRLFDFGGDKVPAFFLPGDLSRTILGNRGIRYLLTNEGLLRRQVACLCAAARGRPFDILIPFVTAERELAQARVIIDETIAAHAAGADQCHVGIMLEVPSAYFLLGRMLDHVDFVSVGTNDLGQLMFAWQREESADPLLMPEINGLMVRIIKDAAEQVDKAGKRLTVCGELATDPAVLPAMIRAGVRSLSVNVAALSRVRGAVREMDAS